MGSFWKVMAVAAVGFVLTGCAKGEFSLGKLSPSTEQEYRIIKAGYDEAFDMALRALQETGLEIARSDKDRGTIAAQVKGSAVTYQDVRTIISRPAEVVFTLERPQPDHLVFTVKSDSGSREGVERFLRAYGKYIEFAEAAGTGGAAVKQGGATAREEVNEPVITEIRTASPPLPEEKGGFTRQEIIEIKAFLYKLGYDPGPADGTMNSQTRDAIEQFTKEYRVVEKLFQPSGALRR